jgi:hypothetical protein
MTIWLNRVQIPEHAGFTMDHPIYTDGSAMYGRTRLAVAGSAAVQQSGCVWREVIAKVPPSLPVDAATGEVVAILIALSHLPESPPGTKVSVVIDCAAKLLV